MTDVLLFQRLSEKKGATTYYRFFRCRHTLPSTPLSSSPIKGIYCSSRLKLSLSSTFPSPFLLVSGQSPPPIRLHLVEISATLGKSKSDLSLTQRSASIRSRSPPSPFLTTRRQELTVGPADRHTGRALLGRHTYRQTDRQRQAGS